MTMAPARPTGSLKARQFTESVIRRMTRLADATGAINLAQGFPDVDPPGALKEAAVQAIQGGFNQYATTFGDEALRRALSAHYARLGLEFDPETEVTVTCGATEAMVATIFALVDPGDEVVVFEPFYENYGPAAILTGARPRYVRLQMPEDPDGPWWFDPKELESAFSTATRAVIVNTPHNPTGKVFTRAELQQIADLACRYDAWVFTDEIYEHILYDGREHVRMATLPGMRERTVTVSGASKTFSVTGWRVGWAIAPPQATQAIRKVHDFLTVGAPAPLQQALSHALRWGPGYTRQLAASYAARRRVLLEGLRGLGWVAYRPQGAYYLLVDASPLGSDDVAIAERLVREAGVATVPGSSFYHSRPPRPFLRFAFARSEATLKEALRRLHAAYG